MSRLDDMVRQHPVPTWRGIAWLVVLLLAGAVGWAAFASLDEVAIAQGEVVPEGQVKVIQHLEGGIVERIHVQDGQTVAAGDPLIELDLGSSGMNRKEVLARLDGLMLNLARLQAEATGEEPRFPPAVAARRDALLEAEREALEARRREFESTLAVLHERFRQRELDVKEELADRRSLRQQLKLARQELGMSSDLLKDGLVSKMEHVRRERDVEKLQGELAALEPKISRAQAALKEAGERDNEERLKFISRAKEELGRVQVAISTTREALARADEQGRRTAILSPSDGVVKNLRYNTIGGVVGAGEPIMQIVPVKESLVVEARLNPIDRGYVKEGQRAKVKISTYDFFRYGGLDGTVERIAADSDTDESGLAYYKVVIRTDRSHLGDNPGLLPVRLGMQATVDIQTGTKSVFEYLVRPVLKLRHEAFRER